VLAWQPTAFMVPTVAQWPLVFAGAALAVLSLFLLSWAYGRAEANVLVPVEYTAFVWLAILGAVFYDEAVTFATLAGAALIVTGCLIAAYGPRQSATLAGETK
jgi:S-adenosylmethionine uptake transporter